MSNVVNDMSNVVNDPSCALKTELEDKLRQMMRLPNSARALGMMNDLADKLLLYKANRRRSKRPVVSHCE